MLDDVLSFIAIAKDGSCYPKKALIVAAHDKLIQRGVTAAHTRHHFLIDRDEFAVTLESGLTELQVIRTYRVGADERVTSSSAAPTFVTNTCHTNSVSASGEPRRRRRDIDGT